MKTLSVFFIILTVGIIGLTLACSPVAQPEGVQTATPTQTWSDEVGAVERLDITLPRPDLTATASTFKSPIAVSTDAFVPSSTPTFFVATATNTAEPTVIPTNTPSHLSLSITLDKSKLASSVQTLIYKTFEQTNNATPNISVWQTDVKDITQSQQIITFTPQQQILPESINLSPNGNFILYGQEYGKFAGLMQVWLLDIHNNDMMLIDKDVAWQFNTDTFLWDTTGEIIAYAKLSKDGNFSSLHLYSIHTKQTQLLLEVNGFINLVSWQNNFIYYIPQLFDGSPHNLNTYNLNTNQIQSIYSFESNWRIRNIIPSPDNKLVIIDSIVIELQTKTKLTESTLPNSLWLPDSQGLINTNLKTKGSKLEILNSNISSTDLLELEIKLPLEKYQLISWSPDGQYLIYKNIDTTLYYLFNIVSGEIQVFEANDGLEIVGWID